MDLFSSVVQISQTNLDGMRLRRVLRLSPSKSLRNDPPWQHLNPLLDAGDLDLLRLGRGQRGVGRGQRLSLKKCDQPRNLFRHWHALGSRDVCPDNSRPFPAMGAETCERMEKDPCRVPFR